MDEGSSVTLMEESLADKLSFNGTSEPLCLKWTGETTREEKSSRRVQVKISGRESKAQYAINDVRTIPNLNLPSQTCVIEELLKRYPHLKGTPIMTYKNAKPELLIGMNNWQLAVPLSVKEGKWHDPIAVETRLGWMICGSRLQHSNVHKIERLSLHMCDCKRQDERIHSLIKNYFSIENFGTKPDVKIVESNENMRAKQILDSTILFKDDRYEAGILWRYDNFEMPETRNMATKRLLCLERKMSRCSDLAADLQKQMIEYQQKGYIRRMIASELAIHNPKAWYLPIFVVDHPFKKKRRIVWDAAAMVRNVCFNSFVIPGPDNIPQLTDILYKFRERSVAICGDLREMYHQVNIAESDKNSLRFLWRDTPNDEINVFVSNVWLFGINCSGCVVQQVVNVNANRFAKEFPEASLAIRESHYRDDWLDSFGTEDEALKIAKNVRFIHQQGGFEMRNWLSNSSKVVHQLNNENIASEENGRFSVAKQTEKVLGLFWETEPDVLIFVLNRRRIDFEKLEREPPTKRIMLRTVMLVFDPLGLISFAMVLGKMLIQDVWRKSIGWDEYVDEQIQHKWRIWLKLLLKVESLRIPRCYRACCDEPSVTEMHTFVDAGEKAYCAVVYFRFVYDEHIEISLITSKARVAPNKPLSIPRLELLAAVLGARLASTVLNVHRIKIDRKYYWSDSKTVISWLNSEAIKYKQFVALRIGEMLELSEADEWRWIPTNENVADDATKWRDDLSQATLKRWYEGPEFLKSVEGVELRCLRKEEKIVCDQERRSQLSPKCQQLLKMETSGVKKINAPTEDEPYSSEEYDRAKAELIKKAQWDCFSEEIVSLSSRDNSLEPSSQLLRYVPYLDKNGILRSKGRIDAALAVSDDVKRKIILPSNHLITRLIIASYHERYLHQNHETTINELRQLYIIPRIRQIYGNVRAGCQQCKNRIAAPVPPQMAALPQARLAAYVKPFTYVGLDYFGPLEVVVGRRVEKRWVALYTCMTVRAIHLELAQDLSSSSCIMSLRNFVNRRGQPLEIFCDNATNFRGASSELLRELDKLNYNQLKSMYPEIKWSFIPPSSPHMGGTWERLIRTVKSNLFEVMPSRKPTVEVLNSFLIEVEYMVNSRPLTHIPIDEMEPEALTPNHFILGASGGSSAVFSREVKGGDLQNNWKKVRAMANHYWHRWIMEYLPDLCRRTKWYTPVEPLKSGDIVILIETRNERGYWPKAIVEEVFIAKDGQARSARIRTSAGVYIRPVTKLAKSDVIAKQSNRTFSEPEISTGVEIVGNTVIENE